MREFSVSRGFAFGRIKAAAGSDPVLNALSLSVASVAEDAVAGTLVGAVQGYTPGASIGLVDDAGGRFVLSGTDIVTGPTGLDYETATSHSITLRETLAEASNSPRDTGLTIAVSDVAEQQTYSSLQQGGVTWTFTAPVLARQTVDGAWIVEGPVSVTSITPAKSGTGAALRNGLTLDPLYVGDASHAGQAWDGRDAVTFNEALEASSFPLALVAGQVAVKCVSQLVNSTTADEDRAGYPQETAALFVVSDISTLPAGPFFSPSPIGWTGRSGFDFWQADIPAAVAALPSLATGTHANRGVWAELVPHLDRYQAMAFYSRAMSSGGMQGWLCYDTGANNAGNYGQWVLIHQSEAVLGMIGDQWSTADKTAALVSQASMGVHQLQLAQGAGAAYIATMPQGMGGHPQWEQVPVDAAILASPDATGTNLIDKTFSAMIMQPFVVDQAFLDQLAPHNISTYPLDSRRREVLAVDTVANEITVEGQLPGDSSRMRIAPSKRVRVDGGAGQSRMRYIDHSTVVEISTNASVVLPVEDASQFTVGDFIYNEAVQPYALGEFAWMADNKQWDYSGFDLEAVHQYSRTNNYWSAVVLWWLATGLNDAQRLPAIRWTEGRYFGWRGGTQPFGTAWEAEFWQEHYAALFSATVGDGGYYPDPAVLSAPVDDAAGTGNWTGSVDIDNGNGTLHFGVYAAAASPSAQEVVDGTGAVVSGSQAISGGAGTQAVSGSGLTASTAYKLAFLQVDPFGQLSNLVTGDGFTTAAATTNLAPDPGFDNVGAWATVAGMTVSGSKLAMNGTNAANASVASSSGFYTPLDDDAASYEFLIDVTRLGVAGKRLRFAPITKAGPTSGDAATGVTTPNRLGGSTITINATGTLGPYAFTVPAGTTHLVLVVQAIDGAADMDLDNVVVRKV